MHLHEIWRAGVRQRHFGYLPWQGSSWRLSRGSCCSNSVSTKFSIVAPFLLKIPWWFLFSTESWPIYSPPLAEVMGDSHEARHGANLGLSHGPQGSDSSVCQDFRGKRGSFPHRSEPSTASAAHIGRCSDGHLQRATKNHWGVFFPLTETSHDSYKYKDSPPSYLAENVILSPLYAFQRRKMSKIIVLFESAENSFFLRKKSIWSVEEYLIPLYFLHMYIYCFLQSL